MPESSPEENQTAIPDINPSRILPVPRLSTLLAIVVVLFLIYAFISGMTVRFYASFLFLFYSLTNQMWISVVLLGVFQTLLLIPLRIINLIKSSHIQEFRETFAEIEQRKEQEYFLKKSLKQGTRVAQFYVVNFFIQLVSYTSIGRLFLTDFYSDPLKRSMLYDFVPYPEYPIQGRFFQIPYAWFSETINLGMRWVLIAWGILLVVQVGIFVYRSLRKRFGGRAIQVPKQGAARKAFLVLHRYATGYLVLFMILAWLLITHFPVAWELRIFSGDVSIPNRTLNTITAVATFFTLLWVNIPKIRKKVQLARQAGMSEEVIDETQTELFKDTFKVATLVGLGAFFITNHIPSAFELSIFTLEIISWLSPLTLDRIILASQKGEAGEAEDSESDDGGDEAGEELE